MAGSRLSISSGARCLCLSRDVEDVELAAGGGLGRVVLGRVVGNVVPVDDVVVPVALALLESAILEFEAAEPSAGFLGIF